MTLKPRLHLFSLFAGVLFIMLVWLPKYNLASEDTGSSEVSKWGKVLYTDSRINIRSGRSPKFRIVGKLNPGDKVKADFLKNEWYAIFDLDETVRNEATAIGYVYAPLLKSKKAAQEAGDGFFDLNNVADKTNGGWGEIKTVHTKVNIRDSRTQNSRIIGKLNPKDKVKTDFLKNGWYAVFDPEETLRDEAAALGFVFAPLLKNIYEETPSEPIVTPIIEPEAEKIENTWGEIRIADKSINIRSKRSVNSSIVGILKPGDRIKVDLLKDGWYAVFDPEETELSENASIGYVFAPMLKKEEIKTVEDITEEFFDEDTEEPPPSDNTEAVEAAEVEMAPEPAKEAEVVQKADTITVQDNILGDPTISQPEKWRMGIAGEYGVVGFERQYDKLDTAGDSEHSAAGGKFFLAHDNWLISIVDKSGDWSTRAEFYDNDKTKEYNCKQEVEETEIKLRSVFRDSSMKGIFPYLVASLNITKFKDTKTMVTPAEQWPRSGTTVLIDDAKYKTFTIGLGAIIAFNDSLGIRGDISTAYTKASETRDMTKTISGAGVGSTINLTCYWKLNKKLYLQAGTKFNNWNGGDEIGEINKKDFVVINLGYGIDF